MTEWKVGDWCIFDLDIVQIKKIDENDCAEVTDGGFSTSGRLVSRLRPLTTRNKSIIESIDFYYKELNKLDGNAGLNFPDISQHFCNLARQAIDGSDEVYKKTMKDVIDFVQEVKDRLSRSVAIQGVPLFRRNLG